MINPIPWPLRWAAGSWQNIRAQADTWAAEQSFPSYSEAPEAYRFHGWGLVGFPPRIACNLTYFDLVGHKHPCPRRLIG